MAAAFFAAAFPTSMSASVVAAETGELDRHVGTWHVGVRTDPMTDQKDHVVSVDDGDYRLAFRCMASRYSVVLFSRGQTPPFEVGSMLEVMVRADKAIPKTGLARAAYPDVLAIEEDLMLFGDIADAHVIRIRMRSDAGYQIDAAFEVGQTRQAMADFLKQCPDMTR